MNGNGIAYFSMEIALESEMQTYSGGLGILAGDTIRSAADLQVPVVAITLLHRKGYFLQRLDDSGWQTEEPIEWSINEYLEEMPPRVSINLGSGNVWLRCWKYEVKGVTGFKVPVYFLDTNLPENSEWHQTLTHYLYGGDEKYRLCQEIILGIGGVRMIRALGFKNIRKFHMNEGHASLLTIELLYEEAKKAGRDTIINDDIEAVRKKCIFTTHTPVPAGHDQFQMDLVSNILPKIKVFSEMKDVFCFDGVLNMTFLGFNFSGYVNGVAKQHGEISRIMFSPVFIDSITNGVHLDTWVSNPFRRLFDRYVPGWKEDNFSLRHALRIPKVDIWDAHIEAKKKLIDRVNRQYNLGMDIGIFTIGFARRAVEYKRWDLLFSDINRLKIISSNVGQLQIIYSGKAHPNDLKGKEIIKRIFNTKELLKDCIKVAFFENYDMEISKIITSGCDVWLNTPEPPLEASGTSGMKAAVNGVPSLSILDGWWIEGHIEGVTGWSFGEITNSLEEKNNTLKDASHLFDKLENVVIPLYYENREQFIDIMRRSIVLNGSYFNTQRMLQEYVIKAYFN